MNTPDQLLAKLMQYEDAQNAVGIWKEAQAYIKRYEEVKAQALDCARSECETTGAVHQKFEDGSCGWTKPRVPRLNREKWQQALTQNERLRALKDAYDAAQAKLEQAQDEHGFWELPPARFFIR